MTVDYIVYVMEGAGIASPLLAASIQYVVNVVMTLPAIFFLDKWGRRPALVIGSSLMMTWLFVSGRTPFSSFSPVTLTSRWPSGAVQHYHGRPNTPETRTDQNEDATWIVADNRPASCAIIACSYLFVATFAATWGPTSWTYPAEVFPSRIRAKAVSISTATNWLFNMALAFAVPPLRTCPPPSAAARAVYMRFRMEAVLKILTPWGCSSVACQVRRRLVPSSSRPEGWLTSRANSYRTYYLFGCCL